MTTLTQQQAIDIMRLAGEMESTGRMMESIEWDTGGFGSWPLKNLNARTALQDYLDALVARKDTTAQQEAVPDVEDGYCAMCGREMTFPQGYEPTECCHECAHKQVGLLRAALAERNKANDQLFETGQKMFAELEKLKQQVAGPQEPTNHQLVSGVKAMRLFVTNSNVAAFRLGYMAALKAAPQPQGDKP